jgi:CRP-like cAMP-binding protein
MYPGFNEKYEYFSLPSADDLFGDLTPESLESLNKIKQTKRLRKGMCLFSPGDSPGGIYLLREGRAQLLLNVGSSGEHFARLIEPNVLLGLTETFAGQPFETRAETITPCLFEFIERADFVQFLQEEPQVCFRLAQVLALNLQKTYRFFSSIN